MLAKSNVEAVVCPMLAVTLPVYTGLNTYGRTKPDRTLPLESVARTRSCGMEKVVEALEAKLRLPELESVHPALVVALCPA
jgi:hypothetical protein